MPKQKTHKGLTKRVKVTANGKIKRKRAGAGHLMSVKNGKRRRNLRRAGQVAKSEAQRVLKALGIK
jgi:large subunit ribosomal protein L35